MKTRGWLIVTAALLGVASSSLVAGDVPKKEDTNPSVPGEKLCQVQLYLVMAQVSPSELRRADQALVTKWAKLTSESGCLIALPTNGHEYQDLLQQLKDRNLVKFMSEARLVTLSGHSAGYFFGGEQAIPKAVGIGARVEWEPVPIGTRVDVLPVVQAGHKIALDVAVEVGMLQPDASIEVEGVRVQGRQTQGIRTSLTVDAGQTFVIGGAQTSERTNLLPPILGDWLPTWLAWLFDQEVQEDLILLGKAHVVMPDDPSAVDLGNDATALGKDSRMESGRAFVAVPGTTDSKEIPLEAGDGASDHNAKMFPDGRDHDFGTVKSGPTLKHAFRIVNSSDVPLHISSLRWPICSFHALSVSVSKQVLEPNEEGTLDVTVDTTRFRGSRTASCFLTLEQGGSSETFSFTITAKSVEGEEQ